MLETEPRATAAQFDPGTGHVTVHLVNGCVYGFPAHLVQDLQGAGARDLANIEVDGLGFNLHWPALEAGRATPPANQAASRSNGAKGGRPRKVASAS
jgi:hypothetical protein